MREWVVGFLMDEAADSVILIRKNRPAWQAGHLNGVGGKVEPGESLSDAMEREFEEEAGFRIAPWERFASLTWEEGIVHFFRRFAPMRMLEMCRTMTDESIERHRIHTLNQPGPGLANVTPNLLWLVPLAAHRHDSYDVIDVVETGTTLRKPGRAGVVPLTVVAAMKSGQWIIRAMSPFRGEEELRKGSGAVHRHHGHRPSLDHAHVRRLAGVRRLRQGRSASSRVAYRVFLFRWTAGDGGTGCYRGEPERLGSL